MSEQTPIQLPDKLYFKIGEVTEIVGVKQHVLRYWESEFPHIRPQKSKTNQRLYRRKDVEAVIAIKHLLYERKFTIEGARQFLKHNGVSDAAPTPDTTVIAHDIKKKLEREMKTEVLRAQNATRDHYEKELIDMRNELHAFLERIKPQ